MSTCFNPRCVFAMLLSAFALNTVFAQVFRTEYFSDPVAATNNQVYGGQNDGTRTWKWLNHPATSSFGAPSFCEQNPTAILCDDLDAYDPLTLLGPQSDHWTTWFGNEGGANDATVSTEQASSDPNSIKIVSTSPGGGLQSAILQLGGLSTGHYELKFKMFIPAGKTAYYDMRQAIPIVMGGNNLNMNFDSTGVGTMENSSSAQLAAFTFPPGEWFECRHIFDLDNDLQTLWINGAFVTAAPFTGALGGVLFMGGNAKSVFYIDDVALAPYVPLVYTVDNCEGAIDLTPLFGSPVGLHETSAIFDNSTAGSDASDPMPPMCFQDGIPDLAASIDNSLWYSFTGDGSKYFIQTVPCNSSHYIDDGDTQMAIFTGECGNFTELLCNEDLAGAVDYRSGLEIQTVDSMNYHMMIDGWSAAGGQFVASGEFCIEVTKMLFIPCSQGAVGTHSVANSGYVCDGNSTGEMFSFDDETFSLPTEGEVHGISWAVSTEPVPANVWPPSMPGYLGSYSIMPTLFAPDFVNNGSMLEQNSTWYFTPVVVANAVDMYPMDPAYLQDLDITGACYFVGESAAFFLLDHLDPLNVSYTVIPASAGNQDGAISLTVSGGLFDVLHDDASSFVISWSGPDGFSSNEKELFGLAPGIYSVIIIDISGCINPVEIQIEVSQTSSIKDPAALKSLTLSPNPTAGVLQVNLMLASNAPVRVEVLNMFGQTLQACNGGSLNQFNETLDLSNLSNGTYLLRVIIDKETALRRVVVNR